MEEDKIRQLKKSPEARWYRYNIWTMAALGVIDETIGVLLSFVFPPEGNSPTKNMILFFSIYGSIFLLFLAFIVVYCIFLHNLVSTPLSDYQEVTVRVEPFSWYSPGIRFTVEMEINGGKKVLKTPRTFQIYSWLYYDSYLTYDGKLCLVAYDKKRERAILLNLVG